MKQSSKTKSGSQRQKARGHEVAVFNGIAFFESYHLDYFLYKPATLHNLINAQDLALVLDRVTSPVDKDVRVCYQLDLRAHVFHAIETLFELVFALEFYDDKQLWYHLSTSDWKNNYERIREAAAGTDKLLTAIVPNHPDLTFLEYVFFYNVRAQGYPVTEQGLTNIKELLIASAKEFLNRDEHNAFKHSLRLFPLWQSFVLSNGETSLEIPMSPSYTFLTGKVNGDSTQHTITFDSNRDLEISMAVRQLISNLIRTRRVLLPNKPVGEQIDTFRNMKVERVFANTVVSGSGTLSIEKVPMEEILTSSDKAPAQETTL